MRDDGRAYRGDVIRCRRGVEDRRGKIYVLVPVLKMDW